MSKLTLTFIITFLTIGLFASGNWGAYTISGYARHDNKLIINDTLQVVFGDSIYLIPTDSIGKYKFEINWHSACPSGKPRHLTRKVNKEINPKYVIFRWHDYDYRFRNKWRRHSYKDLEVDLNIK